MLVSIANNPLKLGKSSLEKINNTPLILISLKLVKGNKSLSCGK